MTTIFTFLSDQYQHLLKQRAEVGADRFELVMRNYKRIFWEEYTTLASVTNCDDLIPKIEHLSLKDKQNLFDWLECFQQTIQASLPMNQLWVSEIT